jgi:hypothetical protein
MSPVSSFGVETGGQAEPLGSLHVYKLVPSFECRRTLGTTGFQNKGHSQFFPLVPICP